MCSRCKPPTACFAAISGGGFAVSWGDADSGVTVLLWGMSWGLHKRSARASEALLVVPTLNPKP